MTTQTPPKGGLLWLILIVLGFFSGLCTIFVSAVTAAQAWQEHAQSRWPEVTAVLTDVTSTRRAAVRGKDTASVAVLSYAAGAEQNVANLHSADVTRHHTGPLAEWIDEHPPETPILVRYDPARPTKVVPAANGMLIGGPRTENNIKLLEVVAGSFLVLLTIARITQPRSLRQSGYSSMPLNP